MMTPAQTMIIEIANSLNPNSSVEVVRVQHWRSSYDLNEITLTVQPKEAYKELFWSSKIGVITLFLETNQIEYRHGSGGFNNSRKGEENAVLMADFFNLVILLKQNFKKIGIFGEKFIKEMSDAQAQRDAEFASKIEEKRRENRAKYDALEGEIIDFDTFESELFKDCRLELLTVNAMNEIQVVRFSYDKAIRAVYRLNGGVIPRNEIKKMFDNQPFKLQSVPLTLA